MTEIAAGTISKNYHIDTHCYGFIMLAALIFASFIITYITERITVPKLGKYTDEEEIIEDKEKLTRKEKRGLLWIYVLPLQATRTAVKRHCSTLSPDLTSS
jgi:aminobenzoyl-glutamate transport protein